MHTSINYFAEHLRSQKRCAERAEQIRLALELCASSEEMAEALQALGFHKYEYDASVVYKDNDHEHSISGIVRRFTLWSRVAESLSTKDEIDDDSGVIRVIDQSKPYIFSIGQLSIPTLKRLQSVRPVKEQ